MPVAIRRALTRYRISAYVVGVLLLVLVLVAMPMKYLAHDETLVRWVGQFHGFLYLAYLVLAFDLGLRARWAWPKFVLVLLAGTVPFLSFVAERKVTSQLREEYAASPPSSSAPGAAA